MLTGRSVLSKSILELKSRTDLVERLLRLEPDAPRRWGTLSVGGMLCHVADGIEQALGRRPDNDHSNIFFRKILKHLVLHMPMPKGAPTSAKMDPSKEGTRPQEFERDRNRVLALLEEAANRPEDRPFAPHPAFGPLTRRQRGILTWKHIDHHLKQFGG